MNYKIIHLSKDARDGVMTAKHINWKYSGVQCRLLQRSRVFYLWPTRKKVNEDRLPLFGFINESDEGP